MATRSILVVEDDCDIRSALCSILSEEGYDVACASDGREAISSLKSGERPAVILLDLMMPVMSGADFRRAQLGDPQLADIPVVVLTADGRLIEAAQALGAAAAFSKPFELDALLDAIARVMETDGGAIAPV